MAKKIAVLALLTALLTPATAPADGPPVPTVADKGGLAAPGLGVHYFVAPAGRGTVVGWVDRDGGRLGESAHLRSKVVFPAVALDGTAGGLSGDGGTLVLARARRKFPERVSVLTVLDARRLRVRQQVRLRGDFGYDALSPDGATLYLIQYTSKRDFTRYAVRAYDLRRDRLLPGRIVDRREPDEDMSGYAMTRATSSDGRWAYTLYDGMRYPFVHALDTARGEAFCIDLESLNREDLFEIRLALAPDGRTLELRRRTLPIAMIDTRTFRVSKPAPLRPAPVRRAENGAPPWPVFAIPTVALLAATGWGAMRIRRRRAPARA